jgi:hypothetical protein
LGKLFFDGDEVGGSFWCRIGQHRGEPIAQRELRLQALFNVQQRDGLLYRIDIALFSNLKRKQSTT